MTNEEKVTAIESLLNGPACNWAVQHTTPAETLARTREIATCMLAILDDVPSVEWHTQSNGDKYAELDGGWKLLTQQCDDGGYSVTVRRGTDLSASEWHIPYRDSAQRRALALYVALRGVT